MNAPTDEHGYQRWQPPVQPPAQPRPSGFRYLWNHPVVIAGVMGLLLLMVTAISIIAIKAVGDEGTAAGPGDTGQQTQQQGAPVATGTTTPPPNQPTGTSGGTPPANSAPAVNSTNAVYLDGKLTLNYYDSGVDLDTAKKSGLGANDKYDFDVERTELTAVNRALAGVGAAAGAPTPAGCTATSVKWGGSAHISVLAVGATICVKTSDDRLGAITVAKLDKSDDGQMRALEVDYVVWKKQGDL